MCERGVPFRKRSSSGDIYIHIYIYIYTYICELFFTRGLLVGGSSSVQVFTYHFACVAGHPTDGTQRTSHPVDNKHPLLAW